MNVNEAIKQMKVELKVAKSSVKASKYFLKDKRTPHQIKDIDNGIKKIEDLRDAILDFETDDKMLGEYKKAIIRTVNDGFLRFYTLYNDLYFHLSLGEFTIELNGEEEFGEIDEIKIKVGEEAYKFKDMKI